MMNAVVWVYAVGNLIWIGCSIFIGRWVLGQIRSGHATNATDEEVSGGP